MVDRLRERPPPSAPMKTEKCRPTSRRPPLLRFLSHASAPPLFLLLTILFRKVISSGAGSVGGLFFFLELPDLSKRFSCEDVPLHYISLFPIIVVGEV